MALQFISYLNISLSANKNQLILMFKEFDKDWGSYWKVGVGCGFILLIGTFVYMRNKTKINPLDAKKIKWIKKKIEDAAFQSQQSLVSLNIIKEKNVTDSNLTIKFSLVENLKNKQKATLSSTKNPFMPPFERGLLITDLPPGHRLIYNKFNILKNHLLIITSEYEDQKILLNIQDFAQCALLNSALNGCFFFNCGPHSGYSQQHKHIQVLPEESLKFPIIQQIHSQIKTNKLVKLNRSRIRIFKGFEFIHAIVIIEEQHEQTLKSLSEKYLEGYHEMRKVLSNILNMKEFSFNLIGTTKFIMMIPRRQQFIFKSVGINACGFMGTILFKDEKLFEQIQYLLKPTEILREITFVEKPQKQ